MATKTLTLDPLFPDGTPAAGTRLSVSVDRDVAIVGQGVVSRKGAVRDYRVGRDGLFPTITVVPNDDPSLQEWSKGYALIIEAKPTSLGGITGGPWTVVITSANAAAVNLSDLEQSVPSPVPNAQVSPGQIAAAITNSTQAIADSSDAKSSAAAAEADASSSAASAAASAALVGAPADVAIATAVSGSGTQTYTNLRTRMSKYGGLLSTENGCAADGTTDDTAALQELINASVTSGAVLLSPGRYVVDHLDIPSGAKIVALGGKTARFLSAWPSSGRGDTVFYHKSTSAQAMLTVNGGGIVLDGLMLDGAANTGNYPLLDIEQAFEGVFRNMRAINAQGGTAVIFGGLQNCRIDKFNVDDSGSTTDAAVVMKSTTTASFNTADFYGLTIERSLGPALDIGYGPDATTQQAAQLSGVRMVTPHFESQNNITLPLIRIGAVTNMTCTDPMFFTMGSGPVILHNCLASGMFPSVRLLGGALNGSHSGGLPTPYLVELKNGDNFAAYGTEAMGATTANVLIDGTYGPNATPQLCHFEANIPIVEEHRSTITPSPTGRLETRKSLSTTMTLTSAATAVWPPAVQDTPVGGVINIGFSGHLKYTTANDTIVLSCYVDGAKLTQDLIFQSSATGAQRISCDIWQTTVTAGQNPVVEIRATASGSGTNHQLSAGHTLMSVAYVPRAGSSW